jgi:hypothetical protein
MKDLKQFIKETIRKRINENLDKTITLYHGTCLYNGKNLINNGWKPIKKTYGANMGNPKFLYLTSEPEDALWFAEEKGCDTVIVVKNIPISFLRPDPEDEAGFTMVDLLDRMKHSSLPSKFILIKHLDSKHFEMFK